MNTEGLPHDQLEKLNILLKLGKVYIDGSNHYCFDPGTNHNLFRLTRHNILYNTLSLSNLINTVWARFKS